MPAIDSAKSSTVTNEWPFLPAPQRARSDPAHTAALGSCAVRELIDEGVAAGPSEPAPGRPGLEASDPLEALLEAARHEAVVTPPLTAGDLVDPRELALAGGMPATVWRHHGVFARFLTCGADAIARAAARSRVDVSPAAARAMLAHLARGWNEVACQALAHRVAAADIESGHPGACGACVKDVFFPLGAASATEWVNLFAVYPVLARLLALWFTQWREGLAELFDRLDRDQARLAASFSHSRPLGRIEEYDGGRSDRHHGGRSVAILTFCHGVRIVYKPRDLAGAVHFMELTAWLNGSGLDHPLHTRRIVARDGYGWEEFVHGDACASVAESERYHWRLGALARLLQLLGGTDFTSDNVVAAGEYPVLVDLETLLAPKLHAPGSVSDSERQAVKASWDSPAATGIIAARVWSASRGTAIDLGAGGPAATAHVASLVDGYVAMAALLRRSRDRLTAHGGPIDRIGEGAARYIFRNTDLYARLLEESLRPRCLRAEAAREAWLVRLRGATRRRAGLERIVTAEIDALRELDIPCFDAAARGTALRLPAPAAPCERFFEDSAWSILNERIAGLARTTPDDDAALIRTALYLVDPRAPGSDPPATPASIAIVSAPDWRHQAAIIGGEILRQRLPLPAPAWTGLDYHPWSDSWRLGVLRPDLFAGTTGLAVLFVDLFRLTGRARFEAAAFTLLEQTINAWSNDVAARAATARRDLRCGAYYGMGAWLYAVARHADASNRTVLLDRATALLGKIPVAAFDASHDDLISGKAGLLLALTTLAARANDRHVTRLSVWTGHAVAGALERWSSSPYPPGAEPLALVPSHRAGMAMALVSISGLEPGLDQRIGRLRSSPDWPLCPARVTTTGDVLAALRGATPSAPLLLGQLDRWLDTEGTSTAKWLETAEVALTAYQSTGRPEYYEAAERCAALLVNRRRSTGHWFSDLLAADRYNLSALVGVGALAHLFLRLHRPDRIGSLRLLA